MDYRLVTFKVDLNPQHLTGCHRVRLFRDGVVYGYPKYFSLNLSKVISTFPLQINVAILTVRIMDTDSKLLLLGQRSAHILQLSLLAVLGLKIKWFG